MVMEYVKKRKNGCKRKKTGRCENWVHGDSSIVITPLREFKEIYVRAYQASHGFIPKNLTGS